MERNEEYISIINEENLLDGWRQVVSHGTHPGIDLETIHAYDQKLEENIKKLLFKIDYGLYCVKPVQIVSGKKEIGLISIEDKIVANCLKTYLNQLSNQYAIINNYGYLEGKSIYRAVEYLQEQLVRYQYVYRCDIANFFPSISRTILLKILKNKISDKKLYQLIQQFICLNVYKNGKIEQGNGLILGNPLSPALSNLYMYELDLKFEKRFPVYVRYSDDMIFAKKIPFTKEDCEWIVQKLEKYDLTLNKEKTKIISPEESFCYLGNEFCREKESKNRVYIGFDDKIENNTNIENNKELQKEGWKRIYYELLNSTKNKDIKNELYQIVDQTVTVEELESKLMERMLHYRLYSSMDQLMNIPKEEVIQSVKLEKYEALFFKKDYKIYIGVLREDGRQEYIELKEESRQDCIKRLEKGGTIAINPTVDGKSSLFVIDLDIDKRLLLEYGDDYGAVEKLKLYLKKNVFVLQRLLSQSNLMSYVEDSGYKGYHIWMFFAEKIEVDQFWKKVDAILQEATLPIGCHMEKIPFLGDECIKIPLSKHLITKKKAHFIEEGGIIEDQNIYIEQIQQNNFAVLENIQQKLDWVKVEGIKEWKEEIGVVEKNCSLIKKIVDKAMTTHYLTHFERNALLYIYGHMGEEGQKYLHYIMENLINYNAEITQEFIDKRKEFPVSCEKLTKRFPQYPCKNCEFKEYPLFYPSPVIYAYEKSPETVTKPDCVNKKERLEKIKEICEPNQLEQLKCLLLELLEKKKKLEEDIMVCQKEIKKYFESIEESKNGEKIEKEGLIMDQGGIYIKLL